MALAHDDHVHHTTHDHTSTSPLGIVRNIVYIFFAALESVLLMRFILSLGGANRTNTFADFIYTLSAPFVAPFRGLLNIDDVIGGPARFEFEVLIAMVVYGVLAWLILLVLKAPDEELS